MIGMDEELNRRLRVIWINKSPCRYVPKSLDGGTGWGVYDQKAKRFLKDKETRKLTFAQSTETVTD